MKTKKVNVFLMFYPINWHRHVFDYTDSRDIPDKVKELQAEYPQSDANDITFVPWGEIDEGEYNDALEWDTELLNDWDDLADDELIANGKKAIKGKGLTEEFIKEHWCVSVSEEVKKMIENN